MNTLYNIKKIALKGILLTLPLAGSLVGVSCSSMLSPESDLVEFEEDNQLNTVQDTLYSVMGIIRQTQVIADRTVLLGEVRADLVTPTDRATTDIKEMAANEIQTTNSYNNIADYYSVINNCNYFLAHADTSLTKLGVNIFEKEYAVVKAYRAWTYLQLAKVYGNVPLVLEPITTLSQAELAQQNTADMQTICEYFIKDLDPYKDYVGEKLPNYQASGSGLTSLGSESLKFFFPIRVLLGELSLWAGHYEQAAIYFKDYLTFNNDGKPTGTNRAYWADGINQQISTGSYSPTTWNYTGFFSSKTNDEILSFIPMEESERNGNISRIKDVYRSNLNNDYYAQVVPSEAIQSLSQSFNYVQELDLTASTKDTVYVYRTGLRDPYMVGDLRLYSCFSRSHVNQDNTSHYSADRYNITKLSNDFIPTYRKQQVYLMYAEALNWAGYPETAFAILKYGLCQYNIEKMKYLSDTEVQRAARFISFNENTESKNNFDEDNTQGVHSRGCGSAYADTTYCIKIDEQATLQDSISAMQPLVEQKIIDEMALEECFEGQRFYALMRMALRHNKPELLALPISMRTGTQDAALYSRLLEKKNWFLPIE